MALERLEKVALGQLHALDEGLDGLIVAQLRRQALQRTLDVVGDRQHVAGEAGDAVGTRIRHLALGTPTQVLHLRKRAQQLVLEVVALVDKVFERLALGLLLLRRRILRSIGRVKGLVDHLGSGRLLGHAVPLLA